MTCFEQWEIISFQFESEEKATYDSGVLRVKHTLACDYYKLFFGFFVFGFADHLEILFSPKRRPKPPLLFSITPRYSTNLDMHFKSKLI